MSKSNDRDKSVDLIRSLMLMKMIGDEFFELVDGQVENQEEVVREFYKSFKVLFDDINDRYYDVLKSEFSRYPEPEDTESKDDSDISDDLSTESLKADGVDARIIIRAQSTPVTDEKPGQAQMEVAVNGKTQSVSKLASKITYGIVEKSFRDADHKSDPEELVLREVAVFAEAVELLSMELMDRITGKIIEKLKLNGITDPIDDDTLSRVLGGSTEVLDETTDMLELVNAVVTGQFISLSSSDLMMDEEEELSIDKFRS